MIGRVSDVPLGEDPASRYLPWTVGLLVFLATLALAVGMVLAAASDVWHDNLSGTLTVQVPPTETGDGDLANRVGKALDVLRDTKGVAVARRLSDKEMTNLLEPWLGRQALDLDLPMPALIDVEVADGASIDVKALGQSLASAVPGTVVDDHAVWLRRLADFARAAETVAFGVILVILVSAVSAVIFTTRTGLAIHRDVIELLHLIGAQDSYVARQFQSHALRLSAIGAGTGFAAGAATVYALHAFSRGLGGGLLPDFSLTALQWGALIALPFAAIALVVVTVGITVMRTLIRMM